MKAPEPVFKSALHQEDRQALLLKVGLEALDRLAERWALGKDAKTRFLNVESESTGSPIKRLERLSHLLGIYRAVTVLFGHQQAALQQWLRSANTAPPFAGLPPIDVILDGCNLDAVRGYLECQLVA